MPPLLCSSPEEVRTHDLLSYPSSPTQPLALPPSFPLYTQDCHNDRPLSPPGFLQVLILTPPTLICILVPFQLIFNIFLVIGSAETMNSLK